MSSTSTHSSRVASMASGTMVSRLTGLFRVLVLAWVLGFTPIADSFNLANTVPNMLFDLVLGGVAGATFIPVFVERLALDGERRAWRSISSVVTGAVVVLTSASVIAWFCAPWIIDGFTAFRHSTTTESITVLNQQRAVATDLLRWFVPQIFFYGVIGIATSLLNIRHRFGVAAWVPLANNVVGLIVISAICGLPFLSPILGPGAVIAQVIGVAIIGPQIANGTIAPWMALPALFAYNTQVGCDFVPVGLALGEAKPITIEIGVPAVLFSRQVMGPVGVLIAWGASFLIHV